MRAAVVHRYGPAGSVSIVEVPRPEPRRGEVLVRVEATVVSAGDARIRGARFPRGFGIPARLALGLRGPRRPVLGAAFSGVVEDAGGSSRLSPGDPVAGMTGARMGAHAEHLAVDAERAVPKPQGVSHEDAAAALFGGTTALYFLRDRARLQPGHRVLVNGASGSVGSAAVQLARESGARVTAITSRANRELLLRLGADEVVDYTETPVERLSGPYDVAFDAVGNVSRALGLRLLAPDGALILAVAGLGDTVRARGRVHAGPAPERTDDIALLLDLVAGGRFDPLTRVLGGLEAAPEAHRLVDSGRKVGNLVIRPGS